MKTKTIELRVNIKPESPEEAALKMLFSSQALENIVINQSTDNGLETLSAEYKIDNIVQDLLNPTIQRVVFSVSEISQTKTIAVK